MRSKLVTGLTAVLMLGMVSGAAANAVKGELMIVPRGGLGLPLGSYPITGRTWSYLKDEVRAGYTLGALVDRMVNRNISLGMQVDYNAHSIRTTQLREDLQRQGSNLEPDFTWKTLQISAHVRRHFLVDHPISLFGQVGAGVYVNKFSTSYILHGNNGVSVDVPRNLSKTDFGMNAGPGLIMHLGPSARFTLEAIFHNVLTAGQSTRYLNITAGVVFSIMPE